MAYAERPQSAARTTFSFWGSGPRPSRAKPIATGGAGGQHTTPPWALSDGLKQKRLPAPTEVEPSDPLLQIVAADRNERGIHGAQVVDDSDHARPRLVQPKITEWIGGVLNQDDMTRPVLTTHERVTWLKV